MNVGAPSQAPTKGVVEKHSVSHMQPSNTNKAFRGYANVVDPPSEKKAPTLNQ